MLPGSYDLRVDQEAEFTVAFVYKQPSGDPVDVTGWTALLQFREAPGFPVLLELTDTAGITVGTTDGRFVIEIHDDQTAGLTFQVCQWDLFVTPPAADRLRLIGGKIFVRAAISVAP